MSPPFAPQPPNKAALLWAHLDDVDASRRRRVRTQLFSLQLAAAAQWTPLFDPASYDYTVRVAATQRSARLLPVVKVAGAQVSPSAKSSA